MQDWNADNFTDSHRRFFHLCSSHQCSIVGTENVVLSDWSLVTYWESHSVRTDVLIDKHRLLFGGKAYRLLLECTTSPEQVRKRTAKEGRGEGKQSLSERRRKKDSSLKRGKKTKQRRKSFPLSLPPKNDDDDKTEMCTCGGATPKKKKHYVI